MRYFYRSSLGVEIEQEFAIAKAPDTVEKDGIIYVKIIKGAPMLFYKGTGWTGAGKKKNVVSMETVDKIMASANYNAKENQKKEFQKTKELIYNSL